MTAGDDSSVAAAAEEPQPAAAAEATAAEPQPAVAAEAATAEPQPAVAEKATTAESQPGVAADARTAEPQPAPAAEATTAEPQPAVAPEATKAEPQPAAAAEATKAEPHPAATEEASARARSRSRSRDRGARASTAIVPIAAEQGQQQHQPSGPSSEAAPASSRSSSSSSSDAVLARLLEVGLAQGLTHQQAEALARSMLAKAAAKTAPAARAGAALPAAAEAPAAAASAPAAADTEDAWENAFGAPRKEKDDAWENAFGDDQEALQAPQEHKTSAAWPAQKSAARAPMEVSKALQAPQEHKASAAWPALKSAARAPMEVSKAQVVGSWRIDDTSRPDFGQEVSAELVGDGDKFIVQGDEAMVQIDGKWVTASRQVHHKSAAQPLQQIIPAAAPTKGKGRSMPGDWECSSCSFNNRHFRDACMKCYTARPEGQLDKSQEQSQDWRGKSHEQSGGNWNCSSCWASNWSSNDSCFKCKSPKPEGQLDKSQERSQDWRSKSHEQSGGSWKCSSCWASNWASNETCYKCKVANAETWQGKWNASGTEGKWNAGGWWGGGDWKCRSCNMSNWACNDACFKCDAKKDHDGGGEGRQLDETMLGTLVKVGMANGMTFEQAKAKAEELYAKSSAGAAAAAKPRKNFGSLGGEEAGPPSSQLPPPSSSPPPRPKKRPISKASKTEEKELLQRVEVMRDECQAKIRKLAEEEFTAQTFEQIQEVNKYLQDKIREAEALLSDAVAMIPVGDLDDLPVRLKVDGFFHHPEFNQAFVVNPDSNVNGSPAYFTEDDKFFMYCDVKTKQWTICPSVDDEEPDRDLFLLARWGGQRGLAIQMQGEALHCLSCGLAFDFDCMFCRGCGAKRPQVSSWSEFNPATGEWEPNPEVKCEAEFEDNRQTLALPEDEVAEYIVNRMNFLHGKPPKPHEKGLCVYQEQKPDKPDKSRFVAWGTKVRGVYKSGWLKVKNGLFLPVIVRGREVLTAPERMDPGRLVEMKAIAAQEPADPGNIAAELAAD
eukprot:TRINITY_DN2892_c0_g2_i1.p1 TRINITY_DN2892_c0_g2~~TRINITY_DN2892_c0_g2_i1.p1  ORF type:complete len:1004 (+),score=243.32 TRINITY_DN2892_c0_g2_i1:32-3043(+)